MDKKLVEDLTKSIDKLTKAIEKANGCAVFKVSKSLSICCFINIIAISLLPIGMWFFDIRNRFKTNETFTIDMTYLIILGGIILCSFIGSVVCLICILKIHRYSLLTTAYNETTVKINSYSDKDNEKMKHTAAVYQHYCQSLTKK